MGVHGKESLLYEKCAWYVVLPQSRQGSRCGVLVVFSFCREQPQHFVEFLTPCTCMYMQIKLVRS